jgi:hypothetical protein
MDHGSITGDIAVITDDEVGPSKAVVGESWLIRLIAWFAPWLHWLLVKNRLAAKPAEFDAVHGYLRSIELDEPGSRYVALSGRTPDDPARVRRTVRGLAGVVQGGNQMTAQIAGASHRSRVVRNVSRMLATTQEPVVLLADAGSGKTRTLQQTALELAQRGRRQVRPMVPIFVHLGQFRSETFGEDESLWDLIYRSIPPAHRADLIPYVETLAREGRLAVLFDSVDEMERASYVEHLVELSCFTSENPGVRCLFACRINDFSAELRCRTLILQPLSDRQILEFVQKNLGAYLPLEIEGRSYSARRLCRRLLSAGDVLGDTARNPQILALICEYLEKSLDNSWPTSRAQLFDFYISQYHRRLLERNPEDPRYESAEPIISDWAELAFRMTSDRGGVYLSPSRLREDWGGERAEQAVDSALESGLMFLVDTKGGEAAVRFAHHRFQEYLAARYIASDDDAAGLIDWEDVFDSPRWQETLLNLISMQGRASGRARALGALAVLERTMREVLDRMPAEKTKEGWAVKEAETERRWADRVEFASRVLRELGREHNQISTEFEELFRACVERLATIGRPTTQVKMLWAWSNAGSLCPFNSLAVPLNSQIDWVREQAITVVAAQDGDRTRGGGDLASELATDLAKGELLRPRRIKAYMRAVRGKPRQAASFAWALFCQLFYSAGLLALVFRALDLTIGMYPIDRMIGRLVGEVEPHQVVWGCFAAVLALGSIAGRVPALSSSPWWRRTVYACWINSMAAFVINGLGDGFGRSIPMIIWALGYPFISMIALVASAQVMYWGVQLLHMLPHSMARGSGPGGLIHGIVRRSSAIDVDLGILARAAALTALLIVGTLVVWALSSQSFEAKPKVVIKPAPKPGDSFRWGWFGIVFEWLATAWMVFCGVSIGLGVTCWFAIGVLEVIRVLRGKGSWKEAGIFVGIIALIGLVSLFIYLVASQGWRVVQPFSVLLFLILAAGAFAWLILDLLWRSSSRVIARAWEFGGAPPSVRDWLRDTARAGGDPERQLHLIQLMPLVCGEMTSRESLDTIVRLESHVTREPAVSEYWRARHEVEQSVRQEQRGVSSGSVPRSHKTSLPRGVLDISDELAGAVREKGTDENLTAAGSSIPRRWVINAGISAVLACLAVPYAVSAFKRDHRAVYAVNGFPEPIEVRIDDGPSISIPPLGFASHAVPEGDHRAVVTRQGAVLTTISFNTGTTLLQRLFDDQSVFVLNPKGAAVLSERRTSFDKARARWRPGSYPTTYRDEQFVVRRRDYFLEAVPEPKSAEEAARFADRGEVIELAVFDRTPPIDYITKADDVASAQIAWKKCVESEALGRFEEARDACNRAIQSAPYVWQRRCQLLQLDLALREFDRLNTDLDEFERDFGSRIYADTVRRLAKTIHDPAGAREDSARCFESLAKQPEASREYNQTVDDLILFARLGMWDELRATTKKVKDNPKMIGRATLLADLVQGKVDEVEKQLSGLDATDDVAVLWLMLAVLARDRGRPAVADAHFAKAIETFGTLYNIVSRRAVGQLGHGRPSFKDVNEFSLEPHQKAVLMVALAQKDPQERAEFVNQARRLKARFLGWDAGASYLDVESLLDPIIAKLSADTAEFSR